MKELFGGVYANEVNLKCPHCGGDYLHHGDVHVFSRLREDSDDGTHVVVSSTGGVSAGKSLDMRLNPSARRNGVLIKLQCEGCHGVSALSIAQHKGVTLVDIGKVSERIDYS